MCDLNSCISEGKARNIIFDVMVKSKIFDRLDLSAEFYEQFNCRNEDLKNASVYLKWKILINQT